MKRWSEYIRPHPGQRSRFCSSRRRPQLQERVNHSARFGEDLAVLVAERLEFMRDGRTIHPLLGERAGVRAVVLAISTVARQEG
jgi:hypothetical protein